MELAHPGDYEQLAPNDHAASVASADWLLGKKTEINDRNGAGCAPPSLRWSARDLLSALCDKGIS